MNEKETKIFKETRLRNLKRTYARALQHPELTDTARLLKEEIETIENEQP